MIKVENIDVWGFEHAIRGMRNPMNSWYKSDSYYSTILDVRTMTKERKFEVGDNDLDLMRRLYKAGTEHRKYLRQIFVSMDITAPDYYFKEFSTYKIGVVENSTSTMHKIHSKKFTLDDFSHENLTNGGLVVMKDTIKCLNVFREEYLKTKDKAYWLDMIQLLPMSYNYKRTITMNYENVVNMIKQRKGHKLDEWNKFVDELLKLPYIADIMRLNGDEDKLGYTE